MKLIILTLFLISSCTSPIAPTSSDISWDQTALGCNPMRPVPNLVEVPTRYQANTVLTLTYVRPNDTLFAIFKLENRIWKLCEWDTSDI